MYVIVLIIIAVLLLILDIYLELRKNKKEKEIYSKPGIVDNTIQQMYDIMAQIINSDEKICMLNNVLIKAFKPKYSSIVLFDGNEYNVKATNVEKAFIDSIKNISEETIFRSVVIKNISKYLVSTDNATLSYKSSMERKIKSAIFSPIYYRNMFLGYWFIEDTKEHAFDGISNEDLERFKHNLSVFIENILVQNTIEYAQNTDKQTGFYNNLYLYSNCRDILISNDTSSITLINLKNIPEINEKYTRNLGNTLIVKIANAIKEIVSKDSILVRYTGLRFLVITPGSNAQITQPVIEKVLERLRDQVEYVDDKKISVDIQILIHTLKKQNNVEKEIQDMVSYIDNMKAINTIKII